METRKRTSSKLVDDPEELREIKSSRKLRTSVRQPKTTEQLLADPKNEIYEMSIADLVSILTSQEAQRTIAEQHPELVEVHQKLIENPDLARRSVSNFKNDGKLGFHDPEWQRQAREAYRRHKHGDFDEYLKWKLYQDWPDLERLDKAREEAEAKAKVARIREKEGEFMDQDRVEQHEENGADQHMSGNSDVDHAAVPSSSGALTTSTTPLTNGTPATDAVMDTAIPSPPASIPAAAENISNKATIPQDSETLTNGHHSDSQPTLNHNHSAEPSGSRSNPESPTKVPRQPPPAGPIIDASPSFEQVSDFLEPLQSTN